MVSDLVLDKELPEDIQKSVEAYVGCIAGAIKKSEYLGFIENAGFSDVQIISQSSYPVDAMFENLESAQDSVLSIKVSAIKKMNGGNNEN
ncbi:hypothetical protein A2346_07980 [candidate division WOR-1 bacterium RIFOXYB12_FULL_52_16]|nr:MAG: hypothetical protein A2346_07980 [candidate division WOR-1 bacterium RIFOXYB12_FULL_52_16]